ncbi:MAG: hypothetical protein ACK5HS_00110 [Mycoplasmatales bacterium]
MRINKYFSIFNIFMILLIFGILLSNISLLTPNKISAPSYNIVTQKEYDNPDLLKKMINNVYDNLDLLPEDVLLIVNINYVYANSQKALNQISPKLKLKDVKEGNNVMVLSRVTKKYGDYKDTYYYNGKDYKIVGTIKNNLYIPLINSDIDDIYSISFSGNISSIESFLDQIPGDYQIDDTKLDTISISSSMLEKIISSIKYNSLLFIIVLLSIIANAMMSIKYKKSINKVNIIYGYSQLEMLKFNLISNTKLFFKGSLLYLLFIVISNLFDKYLIFHTGNYLRLISAIECIIIFYIVLVFIVFIKHIYYITIGAKYE